MKGYYQKSAPLRENLRKWQMAGKLSVTIKQKDKTMYKKHGLTKEEITFIESMIRPMEINDE
jgi:hypothetical protein